jgi:hypothetical protein
MRLILFLSFKSSSSSLGEPTNLPKEDKMRFYTGQHQYYCGIDLHTKNMYICILDQAGKILVHKNISTSPQALLQIIEPFLPDIAITVCNHGAKKKTIKLTPTKLPCYSMVV